MDEFEDFRSLILEDEEDVDVLDRSVGLSDERTVSCPFCGTDVDVFLDPSVGDSTFIDDCSTCCRSIEISVEHTEDGPVLHAHPAG